MCVARAADGAAPTAHVPGAAATATAAAADLSADLRGRSREVRAARNKRRVCVRVASCTAVVRPDAAAAAATLPGPRAHAILDSPCPVCRAGAGRSAVAAPPQDAERAGRGGRPAARNRRNGRRAAAAAAVAARAAAGSVGGVRGAHAARSAATAASARRPRAQHARLS